MREHCAATCGSWVTITRVLPCCGTNVSRRSMTSWAVTLSSAPVGSSAKVIGAPVICERAIATRCACPPESSPMRFSHMSPSPSRASRFADAPRACSRDIPEIMAASETFSSAVSSGMRSPCWKMNPKEFARRLVRCFSLRAPSSTRPPGISGPPPST